MPVDLNEVLALVNKGRAVLDLPPLTELPKGTPGDSCRCVLARAFDDAILMINVDDIVLDDRFPETTILAFAQATGGTCGEVYPEYVSHPKVFKDFIQEFDSGLHPQLINNKLNRSEFRLLEYLSKDRFTWMHASIEFTVPDFPTQEGAQAHLNEFFERAGI